jgi:hypothetical protein
MDVFSSLFPILPAKFRLDHDAFATTAPGMLFKVLKRLRVWLTPFVVDDDYSLNLLLSVRFSVRALSFQTFRKLFTRAHFLNVKAAKHIE